MDFVETTTDNSIHYEDNFKKKFKYYKAKKAKHSLRDVISIDVNQDNEVRNRNFSLFCIIAVINNSYNHMRSLINKVN